MTRDPAGLVLPAYSHIPEYFKTYGPDVADLCSQAYFAPDLQQRLGLDVMFARRSDGLSAAFEFAVVVGRQNLKSGLFKQAGLGWLFVFDERLVVYSAHAFNTAMEMFRDMEELVKDVDFLRKQVKRVIRNHGEEAIELLSGARMVFKTRTKGGGRGLSGRKVILDEGMFLQPMHMGALLPTLSAQPDPQVCYGSSAGMADSEVLRDVRDRGRGESRDGDETVATDPDPRLGYLEWAAPPPSEACDAGDKCTHAKNARGCGCDKPDLWLKANPAIGDRITIDYVTAERRALPVSEFQRERMGWWDEAEAGAAPISLSDWFLRGDKKSSPASSSPLALAVSIAEDDTMAAIGLAGWRDDEFTLMHGELVEHLPGSGWLIGRLMGIVERRHPCVVVLDPGSAAGKFEKTLRNKHSFVTKPPNSEVPFLLKDGQRLLHLMSPRDNAQACGKLVSDITNGKFSHPDQAPLNRAVEWGRSKPSGKAWVWKPATGREITPLEVITMATFGLMTYGEKKGPEPFLLS